jgi:hypothetical protein
VSKELAFKEGSQIWAIQNQYGGLAFFFDEKMALDCLTRKDTLYTFYCKDLKKHG